jgi:hypothetical protein
MFTPPSHEVVRGELYAGIRTRLSGVRSIEDTREIESWLRGEMTNRLGVVRMTCSRIFPLMTSRGRRSRSRAVSS